MARYRKRPVEVEAIQFTGENWKAVSDFCGFRPASYTSDFKISNFGPAGAWIVDPAPGVIAAVFDKLHSSWIGVKKGDYIIRGLQGEYYPHDGSLFPKSYEPVDSYLDHEPLT